MKALMRLKIGSKLILSFAVVLLVMVVLGIFSIIELSRVNHDTEAIVTNWLPSLQTLSDLNVRKSELRSHEYLHIVAVDADAIGEAEKRIAEDLVQFEAGRQRFEKLISSPRKANASRESWRTGGLISRSTSASSGCRAGARKTMPVHSCSGKRSRSTTKWIGA